MIVLDGVSKRYNKQTVLDDVSISFGDDGVTALIGPNGAGKSTLFGIIGRLIRPDGGSAVVDGMDVSTASSRAL
ncbi:MAG: iron transporter ATP-binding protein, partial [Glaciihabitans sp.]|nr:iron transporter ATP-binding protein [Glaciihabitans sp.]